MYFIQILHFAIVSSIVYSTNAATIFSIDKKSNRLEIEISLSATNAKSNETWNIFGKIIAVRSDNVPEKCRCMLPHLCKSGDYSTEKGQCSTNSSDVCCRLSLIPTTIPGGSLAITSESDQLLPSKFQTQQSPPNLYHSGNVSQYECICVHSDQCADPLVTLAGAGQIDNTLERRFSCESPDICCPQESVVREVAEIPMPTSVPNSNPNSTSSFPTIQGECGIRNPSVGNRISAPELLIETSFGEFPWMALILTNETEPDGTIIENVFVCGASLLSSSIVLTAAHCVAKMSPDQLRIRVGEYNTHLGASEPMHHQDRSAQEIIVHPEFKHRVLFNDMALIRVTEKFTLASHISTVCIPIPFSPYADPSAYDSSNCLATGWGKDSSDEGNYQNTLKKVDLTLIEQNECQTRLRETKLGPKFNLHPSFICAGGEIGFDTCEGDGGGPLVCASVDNPNRYIQVGVVSWGIGCASHIPGVYASLYANREWLASEFNSSFELKINNSGPPALRSSTGSPLSTTSSLMETSSSIVSPKQQERKVRKRSIWNQTISLEGDVPESSIGEFPWMALILTTNTELNGSMTENVIICGASLVSASVVLTAAHCIHNRNQHLLKVRVGEHNTRTPVSEPLNYQDRVVSRILSHDEFNDEFLYNDLALIQLSEDFHFTFHISPISLPLTIDPISYDPATCFAIGRGKSTFDDRQQQQPILRKVDLSLVPRDECQDRLKQTTLGRQFKLHSSFICAGEQINSGMCKGDGGGPLVCASRDNPNKYIQVGVESRGIECGSDIPGVYESLEANRKWLTDQLKLLKAM